MVIKGFGYEIKIGWNGHIRSIDNKLITYSSRQSGKTMYLSPLYYYIKTIQNSKIHYIKSCKGVDRRLRLYANKSIRKNTVKSKFNRKIGVRKANKIKG